VEEVIDEAVANALGDGTEKPEKLALEPWLYHLALRAIDALSRQQREDEGVPLQKSARQRNVRGTDEPHLQYHQPDEQLLAQDIIPDPSVSTPEEIAASDEMVTLVEAALLGATANEREAFLLYAVEGFTVDEISAITGRKPEEIRQSVGNAREHLRKSVPMANEFRDKLLQHSRIA
jgi:RNA polymerase sigma factor (sigma-70 family)